MKKLVIFDLDGTLLNTLRDITDSTNAALRSIGQPERTISEIRTFVGNGAVKLLERAVTEPVDEETFRTLCSTYDAVYSAHQQDNTEPYPGTLELLSRIRAKGIRIAVLSNKQDNITRPLVAHYFPSLVDLACGPAEGRRTKPSPDGVDYIVQTLGVAKTDVLFVGDSEVDVRTGLNAGVDTVAVLWGFRDRAVLEQEGAEHFAEQCDDVLDYLN